MSILDLKALLQERLAGYDNNIDVTPGSRADTEIIQPILRRLGPDPFTMDVRAFMLDRLNQEFPDTATRDGDAVSDLLVKPSELLLDPIVREHQRVRLNLSFRDPAALTLDEADALGANYFQQRETGEYAKGPVRVYFSAPQSISVSPANYCTSRSGLVFFPDGVQSIRVEEMLFNVEGSRYYFDVNVIAEKAGDAYNIEANEIVGIYNITAAVTVSNKRRFQGGQTQDDVTAYMTKVQQGINERSLTTKRGTVAQLMSAFPGMTRLNIVGFNDPEMHRDVIEGGGLGPILAAGTAAYVEFDGENKLTSRRLHINAAFDLTALVAPPGLPVTDSVITLHGTWLGSTPVRDLEISKVVSPLELDLVDQILPLTGTNIAWELRKKTLTLSKIPGGILFPDGPNGTVTVEDNKVHIGGAADVIVRGTVLDSSSLVIDGLSDDSPVLSGLDCLRSAITASTTGIRLNDLKLIGPNKNYDVGDAIWTQLNNAAVNRYALQVIGPVGAGTYPILFVTQPASGAFPHPPNPDGSPEIVVVGALPYFAGNRWKLLDIIDVDLVDPKEIYVSGTDLSTLQAVNQVDTLSGVNFFALGVSVGDTVRITNGLDKGDFTVTALLGGGFTILQLDRAPAHTQSNLSYMVFRPNKAGGVRRPLVRITSINLLDTSGQPVGSNVPYAKAIGAYSDSFSNPAHGVKLELEDGLLGIVTEDLTAGVNINGKALILQLPVAPGSLYVVFTAPDPHYAADVITAINNACTGVGIQPLAVNLGGRVGILPYGGNVQVVGHANVLASALPMLFGGMYYIDSKMLRSPTFNSTPTYLADNILPPVDFTFDLVHVVDGYQAGFYEMQYVNPYPGSTPVQDPTPPPFTMVPTGTLTVPACIGLTTPMTPERGRYFQVGSRSFGKARLFFLEPTTVEFPPTAKFTATLSNGTELNFFPDPSLEAQRIPALPGGIKPKDGARDLVTFSLFLSASTDFTAQGIQPGDILEIDYVPITGSTGGLPDPITVAFQTLVLSLDGGRDVTVTFVNDSLSILPTQVTRTGIADQINNAMNQQICKIVTVGGNSELEFEPTVSLIIRTTGTATATLLGAAFAATEHNNQSKNTGRYRINVISSANALGLTTALPYAETREQFKVVRPGTQRVGTTQMSAQTAAAGLYYADIELVSEGTGDAYNLDFDTFFTNVEGYFADGYYLTTEDENTSFSQAEKLHIHFSRSINEVGTNDDLSNATNLVGQNLQVNYEWSALTGDIQSFISSDLERVVCESPLGRHLVPHFIRFDLTYTGGPKEADVLPDITTLINSLFPEQQLEVSQVLKKLTDRGTENIQSPLTMYGVIHNYDRTITLEKTEDRINVGRLAAFIPDYINLKRLLA